MLNFVFYKTMKAVHTYYSNLNLFIQATTATCTTTR
jgi:hypothetical protein